MKIYTLESIALSVSKSGTARTFLSHDPANQGLGLIQVAF